MPAVSHQAVRYGFQTFWLLLLIALVRAAPEGRLWGALLLAGLVSAPLVKRALCSNVCPVFTVGELLWRSGERLFGRTFAVPFWFDLVLRSAKYLVLGWMVWALLSAEMGTEFDSAPISFLLITFLGISLFLQMPWCRYLCPYGALVGLVSMASFLKIRRNPCHCVRCHKCSNRCPAKLPVMLLSSVRSPECFTCQRCVDGCPAPGALAIATPDNRAIPAWLAGAAVSGMMILGLFIGMTI